MKNRRDFLKASAATALAGAAFGGQSVQSQANSNESTLQRRPNIVLFVADQMRWDFIGANRLNPTTRTPNLDRVAERGVCFPNAVTNQPLCCPSRSVFITGRYATETGVWRNDGPPMDLEMPTLATVLRDHGYSTNFIGKWHLGFPAHGKISPGWIPPELRGGFLDFWEGANLIESVTHPYEGTIWNADGHAIQYHDRYRVDFLTDRAVHFLRQPQTKPFLLYISQFEPHFQNDVRRFVAPRGYAERFQDPFVPEDLRALPGNWQSQLPDYYGDIQSIDESVGRVLQTLGEQKLIDNTIFVFTSDHGCHFQTRNDEYKRSPHNSSIRVPFVAQGPGFNAALELPQLFGNINLTPTLLDAAGISIPSSMKGKSVLPLVTDTEARRNWKNEALIQISETMVGRAIRTNEWCYCVADRSVSGDAVPRGTHYEEYAMYNEYADPHELTNLAGRLEYTEQRNRLRERLTELIVASGEPAPVISDGGLLESRRIAAVASTRGFNRAW